jgi:hypothetical protein
MVKICLDGRLCHEGENLNGDHQITHGLIIILNTTYETNINRHDRPSNLQVCSRNRAVKLKPVHNTWANCIQA